ncbi:MAG: hypothetical protein ACFFHV_04460 [Promethearchaeota archaeon]
MTKQSKVILIFNIIFNIFIISIILLPNNIAYPSYGNDCESYHGITIIDIPYDENASIILDGIPSEDFWTNPNNSAGIISIPTAQITDGSEHDITRINMTFIMNKTYLFIFCEWFDGSTKPSGYKTYDGLFLCWNINVPHFSAYFPGVMGTSTMGGGDIDSWCWYYDALDPHGNQSSYKCQDRCYGSSGWYSSGLESDDVYVGLTYRTDYSYSLEYLRKLETFDKYDVQFNEKKLYEFTVAVTNNGFEEDHKISWVYALNMGYSPIPSNDENNNKKAIESQLNYEFLIIIITIITISFLVSVIYYINKRRKV